jgi:Ca2+-dependent lipid-binding protein
VTKLADEYPRETCFLLLDDDAVKSDEDLSLTLWDNDKRSADDLIGRVQLPVRQLISKPNQSFKRTDTLTGFEEADSMIGTLTWSVGFYKKTAFDSALSEKAPESKRVDQGTKGDAEKGAAKKEKADTTTIPPDEEYPSGILSVIVHQINNLERQNLKGGIVGQIGCRYGR